MLEDLSYKELVFNMNFMFSRYPKPWNIEEVRKEPKGSEKRAVLDRFDSVIANFSKEEYKRIITKDFIEHADNHWWMSYYSKSTYYRLKREAMIEFLICAVA